MISQVWSYVGMDSVVLLVIFALWKIIKIEAGRALPKPADHTAPKKEPEADLSEMIVGLGKCAISQSKDNARILSALDSMSLSFDRFAKGQDRWMKQMFGGDGGGYTDMTEAESELRERAEGIRRRYGISWEEAMDRARKTVVYEPDAKMRDNV